MNNEVIEKYIIDGKLDLDKIVDDYSSYVKTIINNAVGNTLKDEDKEEIMLDTFFILWKNFNDSKNIYVLNSYNYENIIEMESNALYEEEREEITYLKNSLKKLKEMDIKIINLYYYSSKSIKDIAKELNISESNVKTKLHRIRKKLNKQLSKGDIL